MSIEKGSSSEYVDYLDFPGFSWKRPEGPPRIWSIFEGRRKMEDGEIPRFSIQEVTKELENDVIDFLLKNFIPDELLCADTGLVNDALAVREFRTLWKNILHQGVSIVALKVSSDPSKKPVIAGLNILDIVTTRDKGITESMMKCRSTSMKILMDVLMKLFRESDVLGRYGVDKYLGALGLNVHPSFRGQGLAVELLRVRDEISIAYQIPATETIFSALAAQQAAYRVGFEVLSERKYSELLDDEGKLIFPGLTVGSLKVMGKRFN